MSGSATGVPEAAEAERAFDALTGHAVDAAWTADVLRRALDSARAGGDPLGALIQVALVGDHFVERPGDSALVDRAVAVLDALRRAFGPARGGDAAALAWLLAPGPADRSPLLLAATGGDAEVRRALEARGPEPAP